jgi:predicted nucleic acid-binding protein
MASEVFIDTNVLVYAMDATEAVKQGLALSLLDSLARAGMGSISTQVLGEFFRAATRHLTPPVPVPLARELVERHSRAWTVHSVHPATVMLAMEGHARFGFSYWDAQLWSAAMLAGCGVILTEDLQSCSEAGGVRFVNPFAEDFSFAEIGM